jgi:hypothetical protein
VTSTYYLLMKRKERETGKNYVYEQVTYDKRKSLQSASNPEIAYTTKTSSNTLNSGKYGRKENSKKSNDKNDGRNTNVTSTSTASNFGNGDLRQRVAEIINKPSKAFEGVAINSK